MNGHLCIANAMSKKIGEEERVVFDSDNFHSHGQTSETPRTTLRYLRNIPDSKFIEQIEIVPTKKGSEQLVKG